MFFHFPSFRLPVVESSSDDRDSDTETNVPEVENETERDMEEEFSGKYFIIFQFLYDIMLYFIVTFYEHRELPVY